MLDGYVWIGVDIISHKASGWMITDGKRDWMAKEAMQGIVRDSDIGRYPSLQYFHPSSIPSDPNITSSPFTDQWSLLFLSLP